MRPILVSLLMLAGCITARSPLPTITHLDTRPLNGFQVDTAVSARAIASYREALRDGTETALCLYGAVQTVDTLLLLSIDRAEVPTAMQRAPKMIRYTCEIKADYIGRWHAHIGPNLLVVPSTIDAEDFWGDTRSLVMLVGVALDSSSGFDVLVVAWELVDRRRGYLPLRGL